MNFVQTSSEKETCGCHTHPLAIASIPMQTWTPPYDPSKALTQGTIFPELVQPFFATDQKLGGGRIG